MLREENASTAGTGYWCTSGRALRLQIFTSTVLVLLVISFYFSSIFPDSQLQHALWSTKFSHKNDGSPGLLHPEEHVSRIPKTLNYHFNITSGIRAPDGVAKEVFLINGQFPGPTIEARSGDEIVIEVTNSLAKDEGISLHYHGLSMRGAIEMDGATGLTQCAIKKSRSFIYRFKIEEMQSGTFWYHAHSDVQRADGLYGAFIVHKPSAVEESDMTLHEYTEDRVILLGDWYHRSAREVLAYYNDYRNFGNEPAPDSLLINGQGLFNCSMAVPARPLDCQNASLPTLNLSSRRTRLRIVNVGALTGFTIGLSGYNLELLSVDGGNPAYTSSSFQSFGILYPGERIDIVVEPNSYAEAHSRQLTVALDKENMKFPNFALTPIQHFPIIHNLHSNPTPTQAPNPPPLPFFNLAQASGPLSTSNDLPTTAQQTFLLYTKIAILSEFNNAPRGFVNWTSWKSPDPDLLPLIAQNSSDWPNNDPFVLQASSGSEGRWVDVVLNNMDDKGHPFHLHGHDFYVLSTHKAPKGHYEAYNPFNPAKVPAGGPMNTLNPLKKDTVFVPRMGYVVLRFHADNPGLWYFHCHVLWHEAVGMALAVRVGGDEEEGWGDVRGRVMEGGLCSG